MSESVIKDCLPKVIAFRAQLIREHCQSEEDAIALATLFCGEAQRIWEQLGGKELAAAQFYRFADRCVK